MGSVLTDLDWAGEEQQDEMVLLRDCLLAGLPRAAAGPASRDGVFVFGLPIVIYFNKSFLMTSFYCCITLIRTSLHPSMSKRHFLLKSIPEY